MKIDDFFGIRFFLTYNLLNQIPNINLKNAMSQCYERI